MDFKIKPQLRSNEFLATITNAKLARNSLNRVSLNIELKSGDLILDDCINFIFPGSPLAADGEYKRLDALCFAAGIEYFHDCKELIGKKVVAIQNRRRGGMATYQPPLDY